MMGRRLLLLLQEEAQLFGPDIPEQLREQWVLTTPALAKIDEDDSWLLASTAKVLSETLGLPAPLCTHTACMRVRSPHLTCSPVCMPDCLDTVSFCMPETSRCAHMKVA